MKDAAPEAATDGTPIDRERPVVALMRFGSPARFSRSTGGLAPLAEIAIVTLQRAAPHRPQMHLHGISVMFERTRDRRLIYHHQVPSSGNRSVTTRKWQPHREKRRQFDRRTKSTVSRNS